MMHFSTNLKLSLLLDYETLFHTSIVSVSKSTTLKTRRKVRWTEEDFIKLDWLELLYGSLGYENRALEFGGAARSLWLRLVARRAGDAWVVFKILLD
jgi:hypothetical protein